MSGWLEFLAPGFLAGLGAVAVPILIHLIHRRRTRLIPFSSLRFLRLLERQVARRRRIQDWLILCLRVGVLACLTLALARPLVRSPVGRLPVVRLIVADNSLSMQARPAPTDPVRRLRRAVTGLLATLQPGDRAAVVTCAAPPARISVTGDRAALRRAALDLRPSFGSQPLTEAVRRALEALRSVPAPRRELVVVTDLQARALEPLLKNGLLAGEGVDVFVLDVGLEDWTNLSLQEARLLPLPGPAPQTRRLLVRVTNWSRRAEETTLLVQGADRRVLGRWRLTVGPRATETRVLTVPAAPGGPRVLQVRLSGDDLAADNLCHVVLPPPEPPRVLLARRAPSAVARLDPAFYLLRALAPDEDLAAADVTLCRTEELARFDLERFALVALADGGPLPPEVAVPLRDYVRRGGSLLIGADPAGALAALAAFPGLGLEARGMPPRKKGAEAGPLAFRPAAPGHPLLRSLQLTSPPVPLDRVHVFRHAGLAVTRKGPQVLYRFSDDAPALVEAPFGAGRLLVLGTTVTPAWTDLPLRVAFLPAVHALVHYLARRQPAPHSWPVGVPLTLRFPAERAPRSIRVRGPETDRLLQVRRTGTEAVASLGALLRPGLYRLSFEGPREPEEALLAAHVDPAEGDLTRLAKAKLPVPVLRPDREGRIPTRLHAHPEGLALARPLLLAALLCFLLEGWLAARRTAEGLTS